MNPRAYVCTLHTLARAHARKIRRAPRIEYPVPYTHHNYSRVECVAVWRAAILLARATRLQNPTRLP